MQETPPPELTAAQRKRLRGEAMRLKPAVFIGKSGVTPTVVAAVDAALAKDQLVKLRIEAPDRKLRKAWLQEVVADTASTICGEVGHTASIFRPANRPQTTKGKPS